MYLFEFAYSKRYIMKGHSESRAYSRHTGKEAEIYGWSTSQSQGTIAQTSKCSFTPKGNLILLFLLGQEIKESRGNLQRHHGRKSKTSHRLLPEHRLKLHNQHTSTSVICSLFPLFLLCWSLSDTLKHLKHLLKNI